MCWYKIDLIPNMCLYIPSLYNDAVAEIGILHRCKSRDYFFSSSAAASDVDTVLLIKNSLTIEYAIIQYTSIAKSVVHSKVLSCIIVFENTALKGAVNGHVIAYTKFVNPAKGFAAINLSIK